MDLLDHFPSLSANKVSVNPSLSVLHRKFGVSLQDKPKWNVVVIQSLGSESRMALTYHPPQFSEFRVIVLLFKLRSVALRNGPVVL